ncbi:hypothetical protein [Muricomes intestini]|jgi:hypothetical protein|uniref:hypothetical protein n=1 Tax=Muricomes intestini TaxID=1796634 RepID=UPI0026D91FF9
MIEKAQENVVKTKKKYDTATAALKQLQIANSNGRFGGAKRLVGGNERSIKIKCPA